MAPHSSTLAWKILWTEEPGRLQSMGSPKSRTRLSDFTFTFHFHALEKEMATRSSVLAWRIPGTGEPGGLPSMGSHRVGHDWSDSSSSREGFLLCFIFLFIYVCIYFWSVLGGGSLWAVLQLLWAGLLCGCSAWAFHCGGFSCCKARSLGYAGFSSCSTLPQLLWLLGSRVQAQELWPMGLAVLRHVGSSWARDLTRISCIGRQTLYHWAAREAW